MDALLWKALPSDTSDQARVRCLACMHTCTLRPGERGRCGVRINREGALYTLTGEGIVSAHADPVEKKPLYHYLPGTRTFSFGTEGCNFTCSFCQNADISQRPRLTGSIRQQKINPEKLVQAAVSQQCASVAFTYTEPTVFIELMTRTATLAHEAGLGTIMVSNGFQTPQALAMLKPLIQAANIDLKSMRADFYDRVCGGALKPVLNNLRHMREFGWWVEVTTLLIPGLNDSPEELRDAAAFIAHDLGTDVPWHVSAFHPAFEMPGMPHTPPATLDLACRIGKDAGLLFVYPGNVVPERLATSRTTCCPQCDGVCLERNPLPAPGFNGHCPTCDRLLPGVWTISRSA